MAGLLDDAAPDCRELGVLRAIILAGYGLFPARIGKGRRRIDAVPC